MGHHKPFSGVFQRWPNTSSLCKEILSQNPNEKWPKKVVCICFKELAGVTGMFNLVCNSPDMGRFLCPGRRPRRVMHHLQPSVQSEGQAGGRWEWKCRLIILSSAGATVLHRGKTQLSNSFWQGRWFLAPFCFLLAWHWTSKLYLQDPVRLWGDPEQPNRYNFSQWDTVGPCWFPVASRRQLVCLWMACCCCSVLKSFNRVY